MVNYYKIPKKLYSLLLCIPVKHYLNLFYTIILVKYKYIFVYLYKYLGAQILKGTVEREIKRGVINFEKLQIKEVSSHFLNGWVYIVIKPVQI